MFTDTIIVVNKYDRYEGSLKRVFLSVVLKEKSVLGIAQIDMFKNKTNNTLYPILT
jgi:hypothetical protein